jgi:hypothetical protein
MKILENDLFVSANVLATNESLNYPAINIVHPFLRKRFQSTTTTSLVTATWDEDQCFSCLFLGFHTLTDYTAVFKDSGGSTLETVAVSNPLDIDVQYFNLIENVRSVEITINGSSGFYVGKIGGGCCYQMPDLLARYDAPFRDNTSFVSSPYGQVLSNNIEPLRELRYGIRELTLDIKNRISQLFKTTGLYRPVFIDLYEHNRDKEAPIYGYFTKPFNFQYNPRRYNFSFDIREAR